VFVGLTEERAAVALELGIYGLRFPTSGYGNTFG
jgi:hypothetical protein